MTRARYLANVLFTATGGGGAGFCYFEDEKVGGAGGRQWRIRSNYC